METSVVSVTSLEELGWSETLARAMASGTEGSDGGAEGPAEGSNLQPGRIVAVHGTRVDIWTPEGPRRAVVRARTLRDASLEGGLAVGDWVAWVPVGAASPPPSAPASTAPPASVGKPEDVVVERVLPRRTAFVRQAAGERAQPQAIAANVDRVFVVTSLEGDFNPRRLERYLVALGKSGADVVIVLGKADLCPEPAAALALASALAPTLLVSARTGQGIDELRARIPRGTTAALVGSSGVGKSAIVNCLLGQEVSAEGAVRASDKRGRHTTTRRELFPVPGGGLLVDTPGMRELKPWEHADFGDDASDAFADIAALVEACRYRDCRHEREPGCAVQAAIATGSLSAERVASWQKLEREREERRARQGAFVESRRAPPRSGRRPR